MEVLRTLFYKIAEEVLCDSTKYSFIY